MTSTASAVKVGQNVLDSLQQEGLNEIISEMMDNPWKLFQTARMVTKETYYKTCAEKLAGEWIHPTLVTFQGVPKPSG